MSRFGRALRHSGKRGDCLCGATDLAVMRNGDFHPAHLRSERHQAAVRRPPHGAEQRRVVLREQILAARQLARTAATTAADRNGPMTRTELQALVGKCAARLTALADAAEGGGA